nr:hypothetical protein [Candidatus Sigynarchaeota archaeon]
MFIRLILLILALNVALIYLKKYISLKGSVKETRMHAAWFWLFLGVAGMVFWFLYADLYATTFTVRYHFFQLGYVAGSTGCLFFMYYIEQLVYVMRYRIFTVLFGIIYVVFLVITALAYFIEISRFVQNFATYFWIPIAGLSFKYLYKINRLSFGKYRSWSVFVILGFAVIIFGYLGSTDAILVTLGLGAGTASLLLQIGGVVLTAWYSFKLPSWKELEWKNSIDSLYVIYHGGVFAYEYDFGKGATEANLGSRSVTVSMLEASRFLLDEAMKTGELKIIDFKNKKIYFESGEYITVIMVTNVQLDTLNFLMRKICQEFERAFASVLPDWNGDSEVFAPATSLIGRILS